MYLLNIDIDIDIDIDIELLLKKIIKIYNNIKIY